MGSFIYAVSPLVVLSGSNLNLNYFSLTQTRSRNLEALASIAIERKTMDSFLIFGFDNFGFSLVSWIWRYGIKTLVERSLLVLDFPFH
jgi:hypothetical protein